MKPGVAFALLLSLLFVGTAVWARGGNSPSNQPSLIGVNSYNAEDAEFFSELFLNQQAATSTSTNLSNTDLISRQMMLEYFDLASKGHATEANITALTEKYVDRIPTLNNAPKIDPSSIRAVANTKINLQYYEDEMSKINEAFATKLGSSYSKVKNLDATNPALYSFLRLFSDTYNESARKMQNLPVPNIVVSAHVRLVNSYFSSGHALGVLSNKENDATVSFASASAIREGLAEQNNIISEISAILIKNGI